jgi:hypothetical protein
MDLDFNIKNYTLEEIENFFRLVYPYSLNDVLHSEKQIVTLIVKDGKLGGEKKNEFMTFVKEAKHQMITKLKKDLANQLENDGGYSEDYEFAIKADIGKVVNQTTAPDTGGGNSFIINKETVSFNDVINPEKYLNPIEAYPTDIARSNLNNLKRKTIVQTVILNSLFREDYKTTSSTDFFLVLPYQFKNVLSIRLSSIQLPNVLYCFSSAKMNNIMFLEECPVYSTNDIVPVKGTIVLPDGNYELCYLALVLEKCINEQLGLDPPRFQVIADTATQKITIKNETFPFIMSFLKDVESNDFNSTMGWILGFRQKEYSMSCVYTTEGAYNGVASDYIFFVLNDFNNSQSQNILAMYSKSYIGNNILAMIPLNTPSFHICFDSGKDFIEKKREYFGPVNLQRMKIELRNQYGELLDLNQMDFSFSLEVQLGYDW